MKRLFRYEWGVALLVGACWISHARGGESPPDEPVSTPSVSTNAPPAAAAAPRIGDPFAMRGMTDGEGFVQAGSAAIPPGIRVVGILSIVGKPAIGALSVPRSTGLHFVREGEVIQIDPAAGADLKGTRDSQLYLLIKSITASQIEISPQTRPQDVRIYR